MKKKSTYLVALFLLLCSFIIVNSFSKYRTILAGDSQTSVASAVVELNVGDDLYLSDMDPLNNRNEFEFYVSNNSDGYLSQVKFNYTVKLTSFNSLPLNIELYKDNNGEYELVELTENTSAVFNFGFDSESHKYKVIILWDEDSRDYNFSKCIDDVKLSIDAVQVD